MLINDANVLALTGGDQEQMLKILSRDVPDNQFIRELTHNGVEAVGRLGGAEGVVEWDYCKATIKGHCKLRVWDTGVGMDGPTLLDRMNSLGSEAATDANYGVGSKIALYRASPAGVVYYTMQAGVAVSARIGMHNGHWGVQPVARDDTGDVIYCQALTPAQSAALLPKAIRAAGHGTAVVLLGESDEEDTVRTLQPGGETNAHWVGIRLNERYTSFPDGVKVRATARGGKKTTGTAMYGDDRRRVYGRDHYLAYYSSGLGGKAGDGRRNKITVTADGMSAEVHWWLLDSQADVPSFVRLGGAVRTVSDGEVYDGGASLMTKAGIYAKARRVELHIVPLANAGATPNIQRTGLTAARGADLPLDAWCLEFRKRMPGPIRRMLDDVQLDTVTGAGARKRLSKLCSSFAVVDALSSRGRRRGGRVTGVIQVGAPTPTKGRATHPHAGAGAMALSARGERAPRPGGATCAANGVSGRGHLRASGTQVQITAPRYQWVDANADGDAELAPYAARFDRTNNVLTINVGHATYCKLSNHWNAQYPGVPGAPARIDKALKDAVSWKLTDQIAGVFLTHPGDGDIADLFLSPQALTGTMYGYSQPQAEITTIMRSKMGGLELADELADELAY